MFLSFISALLTAVYTVYSEKEQFRDRPLKGLLQTVQVILYFVGGIIVVSILIDRSPGVLLTGLGASAAVLMLVFKDSIMGFVSGVQLSANNMLKVGDWITMPKYGADGDVIEVSLNTVKVRNFDKNHHYYSALLARKRLFPELAWYAGEWRTPYQTFYQYRYEQCAVLYA